MPATIADGRARFGVALEEFYRRPELAARIGRRGVLIPPTSDVAREAAPALAYVNPLPDGSARWIADCPDCKAAGVSSAEYVWIDRPLFFCATCGNRDVGGRWRRVVLPAERRDIERLLLARPDPATRVWTPGETLDRLRAENAALAVGR